MRMPLLLHHLLYSFLKSLCGCVYEIDKGRKMRFRKEEKKMFRPRNRNVYLKLFSLICATTSTKKNP